MMATRSPSLSAVCERAAFGHDLAVERSEISLVFGKTELAHHAVDRGARFNVDLASIAATAGGQVLTEQPAGLDVDLQT